MKKKMVLIFLALLTNFVIFPPQQAEARTMNATLRVVSGGAPVRPDTYAASGVVRNQAGGTTIAVTAFALNTHGNLWFRIGTGAPQWIYSGNIQMTGTIVIPTAEMVINPATAPVRPNTYANSGTIRTLQRHARISVNGIRRNSHGNMWFRLTDGNWIYSRNVRELIWHSNENNVRFWPGTINVHTRTIGTPSAGFNFLTRVTEARNAWSDALGVPIGLATQANAQIIATGGSRSNMEINSGREVGSTTAGGWARPASITLQSTMSIGGSNRRIYRLSGQAQMWVVERSTAATWSADNINRTRKTTTHELGHALGYRGHVPNITANNHDVMWASNTPHFRLLPNERRHLRQIYDRFR